MPTNNKKYKKKYNKNYHKKNNKARRNSTQQVTHLSNDELMDKIINKSKVRKEKIKNYQVRERKPNDFQRSIRPSRKITSAENDELLEKILTKSKERKLQRTKKLQIVQTAELPKLKEEVQEPKEEPVVSPVVEEPKVEETPAKESEEDLIITKQIVIDVDKLDVKDKKVIEKIRQAVEDEQAKDETFVDLSAETKEFEIPGIQTEVKLKHHFDFSKLLYLIPIMILFISIGTLVVYFVNVNKKDNKAQVVYDDSGKIIETKDNKEEEERLKKLYNECLSRSYDERDNTDILNNAKAELDSYLTKYKTSIMYSDTVTGYEYSYNPNKVYYAASTMKSLAAIYLYTKAAAGEINLDETMTYSSKYSWTESMEMKKHRYGDKIPLRDLVRYAITVSDNSAYQMLVSYIGRQRLKDFGRSLGATYTLTGGDNFGNINVNDAVIYMKTLNSFIENNGELGEELKQVFLAALQNDLEIPEYEIKAAHKYGEYKPSYHDIGIVYDSNPYIVAILSTEGYGDFEGKIKDINKHVYRLHSIFWENRKGLCSTEVYK